MLYHLYELNHALIAPLRAALNVNRFILGHDWNPFADTYPGKVASAALEVFDRVTKPYVKPAFGIDTVAMAGCSITVSEDVVHSLPFGDLLHFRRDLDALPARRYAGPTVLIVAPLSGHYATLLRGTVKALLAASREDKFGLQRTYDDLDLQYREVLVEKGDFEARLLEVRQSLEQ